MAYNSSNESAIWWTVASDVRSLKFHIKSVILNTNLTFEELYTSLTQTEDILNSRPLVVIDNDNNSDIINILTWSHILICEVITSPTEPVNEKYSSLRFSLGYCLKFKFCFWRWWSIDYCKIE